MRRSRVALLATALLAVLVAVPVLASKPSAPPGQAKDKTPKSAITLKGTVEATTDADGETVYTLAEGGTTYTLEAGPRWYFGDDYPLKPFVGKAVTIVGEKAEGSNEVDVISVDGKELRAAGKPPWAGGWKVVGQRHPGWSQEKADRMKGKFGDCFPPGQCKDKSDKANGAAGTDDADESAEPKESEAP